MKSLAVLAFSLATLSACATIDQAALPKNNFTMPLSSKSARDAVVASGMAHGYRLSKSNEYQIELDRTAYGFANSVAFGTGFNGTPSQRISVTFIGSQPTRATATMGMVSNPGTAHEIFNEMSYLPEGRAEITKIMTAAGATPSAPQ